MAKQQLSILQQALFEEKKLQFSKRLKKSGKQSYSDQMKIILPNYKPMYKQQKFIDWKAYINWIIGGFQSGKTEGFAAKMIWLSEVNAPYPGLIISPTATNSEVVMLRKLKKLFLENDIAFHVKRLSGLIEVSIFFGPDKTGTLFLGSGESTAPWIGMTVAFAGMDEPFRQSESTNIDMISRVSEPNAVLPMINYSGTAEPDTQDWGEDIIDAGEEYTDNRSVTLLSTRDNIYLRPGYVKSLEDNMDSEQQRNYISGIATSRKGGKMYYMYDDNYNKIPSENFKIDKNIQNIILLIYDFNVNPMSAAEFLIRTPELIEVDEYKLTRSNTWDLTEVAIQRLLERYSVPGERRPMQNTHLIISGDMTSQKGDTRNTDPNFNDYTIVGQLFSKAGISYHMELTPSNPLVQPRVTLVNNLFEKRFLKILSHCTESIEDMKYVKQKKGVEGFKKDKSNSKRTHMSDIIDYAAILAKRMGTFPLQEISENREGNMSFGDERIFK